VELATIFLVFSSVHSLLYVYENAANDIKIRIATALSKCAHGVVRGSYVYRHFPIGRADPTDVLRSFA